MSFLDVNSVVVPIDFSEQSSKAVAIALEIAKHDPHKVSLIHVLPELSAADPGVIWGEVSDERRAQNVKDAMREQLSDQPVEDMHLEVAFGDAGLRIADFCQEIGADLVVIPSHGRTGIDRLLIGSVAERVIQHVKCPVLVLRGDDDRK